MSRAQLSSELTGLSDPVTGANAALPRLYLGEGLIGGQTEQTQVPLPQMRPSYESKQRNVIQRDSSELRMDYCLGSKVRVKSHIARERGLTNLTLLL